MTEAKGQNEPSMEEILASIRRIIAEDGEAPPPPPAKPAAAEAPPKEVPPPAGGNGAGEEILDLTEVVEPEPPPAAAELKPAPPPPPAPSPPAARAPDPLPRMAEPEPEPEPPTTPPRADERLVSEATAAASVAALSQLTSLNERLDDDIAIGDGHKTLEGLVRSMLKPLLRDWLDAHLPSLVERLVREEIARMVREARSR